MYYKKLKATLYFKNIDYFLKVEKKKSKKKKTFFNNFQMYTKCM